MVKRYHHKTKPDQFVEYESVPNGIFVNYDDYAALEARCRAAETDRDSWRRLAERYETNCTGRHGSQQSCGNFPTTLETKGE